MAVGQVWAPFGIRNFPLQYPLLRGIALSALESKAGLKAGNSSRPLPLQSSPQSVRSTILFAESANSESERQS